MPILNTDQFGPGTLYMMENIDRVALLKRDVAYVSSAGPAIVIDAAVSGNATLTIDGTVSSGGRAIALTGSADIFLSRYVNIGASGSVRSSTAAITALDSDLYLTNDGTISALGTAIAATRSDTSVYFNRIINNGTISSNSGLALSFDSGNAIILNSGVINGSVFARDMNLTNIGTIIGNVIGGIGFDVIDTHAGVVTGVLAGGAGGDLYIIAGTEQIDERPDGGVDRVESYADYRLPANLENLILRGAARTGYGNPLNNLLIANDQGNSLYGGLGNDVIQGGVGDDVLSGGSGDDIILVSSGADVIAGGTGIDQLTIDLAGDFIIDLTRGMLNGTGIEGGRLSGVEDVRIIFVPVDGSGNDTIIGSAVANRLDSGTGDDRLRGEAGDDILIGGRGNDVLNGGTGIDTVSFFDQLDAEPVIASLTLGTASGTTQGEDTITAVENLIGTFGGDTLEGDALANVLDGGGGDDTLRGLDGGDTLIGGADTDFLTGGGGRDIFLFAMSWGTSGTDTILDFQNGVDRISFLGGVNQVTRLADIAITANPAAGTVTLTSVEGVIRLRNTTLADIDATDFIFDPVAPVMAALSPFEYAMPLAAAWGQMAVPIP